jgi:Outer membrane protein beta-barrel domain
LPITLKYSFGNKLKPYVKLGGYASYLLKAEGLPFNQIRDINTIQNVDLKSDTKNFDYGILFGAGLECKINKKFAVFAETNAIYGLQKFDKISQNKQHYVSAELGLKFYLTSFIKK